MLDPVCGMTVDPQVNRQLSTEYEGKQYYFCCKHCLDKFNAQPEQYLKPNRQHAALADGEYTCPMHLDVLQIGPGICPFCAMSLEPVLPLPNVHDDAEEKSLRKKLMLALLLGLPVVIFSMLNMFLENSWLAFTRSNLWQMILASLTIVFPGSFIFARAWNSLLKGSFNMFTLIALGAGAAYFYSLIATLYPAVLPNGFRGQHGETPVYFESICVIIILVILGQLLELKARNKASDAMQKLLSLNPKQAHKLMSDGQIQDVDIDKIAVGDLLKVFPGEKIPADGLIIDGSASIDESTISGESMPVDKHQGSYLTCGTQNILGSFIMQAKRVGETTLLSQIIALVAQAQRSRAPIQSLVDKISAYFVFIVMAISAITFIAWAIYGPEPKLAWALVNAISVLIVACPCALGLATPMSITVAVGKAASENILVKDAQSLESLANVNLIAFDKTGTLTEGKPEVIACQTIENFDANELLFLAACVAANSEHPLAKAICAYAREKKIDFVHGENFNYFVGKGITALVNNKLIAIGNDKLIRDLNIAEHIFEQKDVLTDLSAYTPVIVACQGKIIGQIIIADSLRKDMDQSIAQLKKQGYKICMLTGDKLATALAIGQQVGIDPEFVFAGLLPQEKAAIIDSLKDKGNKVAFVGDGINDALALAKSDIGIAMGHGAEVTVSNANITLLHFDSAMLNKTIHLSKLTLSNIRQNLMFAFAYNAVGIIVATGLLYPQFGILLDPMLASFAMSMSSLCVVGNSLRLKAIVL
jgi:Cu+-exporting ATPase